jgi:two-component system, LytTR family, sensor kinase
MKKKHTILLHILFWSVSLTTIGLEAFPYIGKDSVSSMIYDFAVSVSSFIAIFYSFYFFISDKYLKKEYVKHLIIFGILFNIIVSSVFTFIDIYLLERELFDLNGSGFLKAYGKYFYQFLELNFIYALSGSLIKISLLWYKSMLKQKEAEKKMLKSEVELLKTQINPEFLVSSLKELISRTEQSPEAAVYIIENLSEIMSYMLYESTADKVLLDKEVKYINNYLNLQGVRCSPGFIDFTVTGNISGIMVPPLLFMPFIENAFKNGYIFSITSAIIIKLGAGKNNLSFEIINSVKDNYDMNKQEGEFNIKLIKRRLDLLFVNNYDLETKYENDKYLVKLNVNLAE